MERTSAVVLAARPRGYTARPRCGRGRAIRATLQRFEESARRARHPVYCTAAPPSSRCMPIARVQETRHGWCR